METKTPLKGFVFIEGKKVFLKTNVKNGNSRLRYKNTCEYCGVYFLSNRSTARFCSDRHRLANFREMNGY